MSVPAFIDITEEDQVIQIYLKTLFALFCEDISQKIETAVQRA